MRRLRLFAFIAALLFGALVVRQLVPEDAALWASLAWISVVGGAVILAAWWWEGRRNGGLSSGHDDESHSA